MKQTLLNVLFFALVIDIAGIIACRMYVSDRLKEADPHWKARGKYDVYERGWAKANKLGLTRVMRLWQILQALMLIGIILLLGATFMGEGF